VRTSIGVRLVVVCLALTGCNLPGKRQPAPPPKPTPFTGAPPAPEGGPSATPVSTSGGAVPAGVNGLLAGQVLDKFNRRPTGVYIQVIDIDDPKPSARLDVPASKEGYFTIKGLEPGHHYRLIARVKDDGKILSGTTLAVPPNPRLSIYVSEDYTTPDTPPIPAAPVIPGTKPLVDKSAGPAAVLEAPVKTAPPAAPETKPAAPPTESKPAPAGPAASGGTPPAKPDPTLLGDQRTEDGFTRAPPAVSVPGQDTDAPRRPAPRPRYTPPAPPTRTAPDDVPPLPPPMPAAPQKAVVPRAAAEGAAPPVPFCVRPGKRLENFALYDVAGRPWELSKSRKGRLVLLDFWHSECTPCLHAIGHMVYLHDKYKSYGLEVVGISYDRGTAAEKRLKVNRVKARFRIEYPMLLGGGGAGPCPVGTQLQVHRFPTVILIDETGQIVWRSEGLDARGKYDLEMEIRRGLNMPLR
jgi:thiol-disulfide isomerase/thioredoxin